MVDVEIPRGTNEGDSIKLPNYGIAKDTSRYKGDHILTFKIHIPTTVNPNAKSIYEELKQIDSSLNRDTIVDTNYTS